MPITLSNDAGLATPHPEFAAVWSNMPKPADPNPPLEARRALWTNMIIPNLNEFLEPSLPSGEQGFMQTRPFLIY